MFYKERKNLRLLHNEIPDYFFFFNNQIKLIDKKKYKLNLLKTEVIISRNSYSKIHAIQNLNLKGVSFKRPLRAICDSLKF